MMRVVQAHVDVSPHTPTAPIYIGGLAGSFCTATYSPLPCLSFVLCCAGLWCALGCSGLPACPHSWGRPTSGCPPPPTHPHPPPAGHLLEGCRGQQACGARWPCAVLPPAVSWVVVVGGLSCRHEWGVSVGCANCVAQQAAVPCLGQTVAWPDRHWWTPLPCCTCGPEDARCPSVGGDVCPTCARPPPSRAADGSEEAMVPLVIELKSKAPDTVDAKGGAVYSRQALAHDPKLQASRRSGPLGQALPHPPQPACRPVRDAIYVIAIQSRPPASIPYVPPRTPRTAPV